MRCPCSNAYKHECLWCPWYPPRGDGQGPLRGRYVYVTHHGRHVGGGWVESDRGSRIYLHDHREPWASDFTAPWRKLDIEDGYEWGTVHPDKRLRRRLEFRLLGLIQRVKRRLP
jgi:hypothetical protein